MLQTSSGASAATFLFQQHQAEEIQGQEIRKINSSIRWTILKTSLKNKGIFNWPFWLNFADNFYLLLKTVIYRRLITM